MQFEHERYVRLYVRDTVTWRRLQWDGQVCMLQLLRRVDDTGCIDLAGAQPWEAAVSLCGAPADVAQRGVTKMLELGVIVHEGDRLAFPRYVAANKAAKSDKQRAREYRARRALASRDVTAASQSVMGASQRITARHDGERNVTPGAFRFGHELMFEATGRQFGNEWRDDLEAIGSRPEPERRAVVAGIQGAPWARANPTKVTPRHVLRMWADYVAGAPAMQLASKPAEAPPPTELEQLYGKFRQLQLAREACLYDEDAKKARLDARMTEVSAQIQQLRGGANGRA